MLDDGGQRGFGGAAIVATTGSHDRLGGVRRVVVAANETGGQQSPAARWVGSARTRSSRPSATERDTPQVERAHVDALVMPSNGARRTT